MEDPYIYFELNGCQLKINENDSEDIWIWNDRNGERMYKNPYWRKPVLKNDDYIRVFCNQKHYPLHRIVYYAHNQDWDIDYEPRNNMIDHIDRNKSNNHISNLRVGTNSLNQQNRSEKSVKGYSWHKKDKKYKARITINNKQKHLGSFKTEAEAREAYLEAKKLHHKW